MAPRFPPVPQQLTRAMLLLYITLPAVGARLSAASMNCCWRR